MYQGFVTLQGYQKNIFRQNSLHLFQFCGYLTDLGCTSRLLLGIFYCSERNVFDAPLDLCVADEDEPSHVSGHPCANISSFDLFIRQRPAKLLKGLKVEWNPPRQILRCHPVAKRMPFYAKGGALPGPRHG